MDLATFNRLLSAAAKNGASDVHFKTDATPAVRVNGAMVPVKCPALAPDDMGRVAMHIMSQGRYRGTLDTLQEWDTSYRVEDIARFRVSLYRQRGQLAAILRVIPFDIPTFEQLGLPPVIEKIASEERGLILITGVAGSGKSSTLAAMIDFMNARQKLHIVTIEDPIEFVHRDKLSRLSQREVGLDTPDFASALRAALRQDPDVILVGEMRDPETIDIALKAAETGHLVLSTVHTTDAARTISRIIGSVPSESQTPTRLRLAEILKATISQRLLPHRSGKGRVLACEVMVSTLSVQDMIRQPEKMSGLREYLEQGGAVYGSQSFDQHLLKLFREEKISQDGMLAAATNAGDIQRAVTLGY